MLRPSQVIACEIMMKTNDDDNHDDDDDDDDDNDNDNDGFDDDAPTLEGDGKLKEKNQCSSKSDFW